jgi:hypothetical protein
MQWATFIDINKKIKNKEIAKYKQPDSTFMTQFTAPLPVTGKKQKGVMPTVIYMPKPNNALERINRSVVMTYNEHPNHTNTTSTSLTTDNTGNTCDMQRLLINNKLIICT